MAAPVFGAAYFAFFRHFLLKGRGGAYFFITPCAKRHRIKEGHLAPSSAAAAAMADADGLCQIKRIKRKENGFANILKTNE